MYHIHLCLSHKIHFITIWHGLSINLSINICIRPIWLHTVPERNCGSTWRHWVTERRDALGHQDCVKWEMYLEAAIKWVRIVTWIPWSSTSEDALRRQDHVTQWCTWRPWSDKYGKALGGLDQPKLVEYLQVVNVEVVVREGGVTAAGTLVIR